MAKIPKHQKTSFLHRENDFDYARQGLTSPQEPQVDAEGQAPTSFTSVPLKALPSLPLAPELRRKMLDSALKSVDFSGIKPQNSEIKRLLRQGLRPGEARLAAQWQQHFKVRLLGFNAECHRSRTHMKHLRKAHIVPMFMGLFDASTASKVLEFLLTLPEEQQAQIVMIWRD